MESFLGKLTCNIRLNINLIIFNEILFLDVATLLSLSSRPQWQSVDEYLQYFWSFPIPLLLQTQLHDLHKLTDSSKHLLLSPASQEDPNNESAKSLRLFICPSVHLCLSLTVATILSVCLSVVVVYLRICHL